MILLEKLLLESGPFRCLPNYFRLLCCKLKRRDFVSCFFLEVSWLPLYKSLFVHVNAPFRKGFCSFCDCQLIAKRPSKHVATSVPQTLVQ